jgi:glucan-binding YG repeat protein
MNKKYLIPFIALGISVLAATSAFAEGWTKENNIWTYQDSSGNKVTSSWKRGADGEWRYLDANGYMATNAWVDDNEYYVDSSGKIEKGTWKQATDPISGGSTMYWFYLLSDGKVAKSTWRKINDKYYYFDEDGHMLTGWVFEDTYYLGDDGAMKTGWAQLEDPDGNSSSDFAPGDEVQDGENWYYFSSSGRKYCAENDGEYIEKRISGKKYCFDSDGVLQFGWVNMNGEDEVGEKITDYKYYNSDGTLRTGWYSLVPPADLDGHYEDDVEWFYFNSDGTPRANDKNYYTTSDFTKIGGKTYMFNEWGTPVYGIKKVYLSNSLSSYTAYYFGTKSQSNLQKGTQKIDEYGTTVTYFFTESSGVGYTGVKSTRLYYMGRLQKADSDTKYEIVSLPSGSDTYSNYLVNSSGKVMKKSKVKDADGLQYITDASGIVTGIDGVAVSNTNSYRTPEEPTFE